MVHKIWKNRARLLILSVFLLGLFLLHKEPLTLQGRYSTILTNSSGHLLSARLAVDGQWRFPPTDSLPAQYAACLRWYEDRHFYHHPGINPLSMLRAMYQNIRAWRVVSGGSTITMQVVKMLKGPGSRSLLLKIGEMFRAFRLEIHYSKTEILTFHANHAPFGGNVVGLEAAAWRYFGRSPHQLTWAEYAMLAVLPNKPGLIHPGRNRDLLAIRRNNLLTTLYNNRIITADDLELALFEPLPSHPQPLPQLAPWLLQTAIQAHPHNPRLVSTIDLSLQQRGQEVLDRHISKHIGNQIGSGAIVVAQVATGKVLVYIGNTQLKEARAFGSWNDMAATPRSTGSVLKPFLYASMLSEGRILPHSLVEDLPYYLGGYAPKNYHQTYDGLVPASKALSRSLNVPAVLMLHTFGVNKFITRLQTLGMTTLHKPASHYGLSLILGGAECTLFELTGMYATMARQLLLPFNPAYTGLTYLANVEEKRPVLPEGYLNLGAVYHTFNSMEEVARPDNQIGWESFSSSRQVAWKTGTSFGYRDAWAVGTDGGYVVGVWMGNADGTGREGLVGVEVAAPVMFDIFNLLPHSPWFESPEWAMKSVKVCKQSGHPAFDFCPETDSLMVPDVPWQIAPCPYHKMLMVSIDKKFQVNDECTWPRERSTEPWFVLPPIHAHFFAKSHAWFTAPPPFRSDCTGHQESRQAMSLIYPPPGSGIKIPVELDGTSGKAILQLAHNKANTRVFWYLDEHFLGTTNTYHEMAISPQPGTHRLMVTDELGNQLTANIQVLK